MLTAREILDALTYDGNIEVDGDEAIRIVNRLTDLQEQKLNKAILSAETDEKEYKCSACGQSVWLSTTKANIITYCEIAKSEAKFIEVR